MASLPATRPSAARPRLPAAGARAANASRPFDVVNAASPSLRFGRDSRLAQSRDFARVRQKGERLALGCLIANWNKLPAGAAPKLGVVTSKKIGGAVVRSRARRLLRETFRRHQYDFAQPVELVLVARNSIVEKDFAAVEKDFLTALRRAKLLKN
jgi:ribonuclease P protein component